MIETGNTVALDMQEAATYLGIDRVTFWRWRKVGRVPDPDCGKLWLASTLEAIYNKKRRICRNPTLRRMRNQMHKQIKDFASKDNIVIDIVGPAKKTKKLAEGTYRPYWVPEGVPCGVPPVIDIQRGTKDEQGD